MTDEIQRAIRVYEEARVKMMLLLSKDYELEPIKAIITRKSIWDMGQEELEDIAKNNRNKFRIYLNRTNGITLRFYGYDGEIKEILEKSDTLERLEKFEELLKAKRKLLEYEQTRLKNDL